MPRSAWFSSIRIRPSRSPPYSATFRASGFGRPPVVAGAVGLGAAPRSPLPLPLAARSVPPPFLRTGGGRHAAAAAHDLPAAEPAVAHAVLVFVARILGVEDAPVGERAEDAQPGIERLGRPVGAGQRDLAPGAAHAVDDLAA